MPIRGPKAFMPTPGKAPSGIFSTRGKQKADSTANMPAKSVMHYSKKKGGGKSGKAG